MTEYQKLTSYFGERQRSGGAFVADALLELYGRHKIAASILLRGTEGFGLKHHLRTDRVLTLSEDLPMVSVAVDTHELGRPQLQPSGLEAREDLSCEAALHGVGLDEDERALAGHAAADVSPSRSTVVEARAAAPPRRAREALE